MTTFAASRMRPRTDLASNMKPRITRRFGIHGRRARKYRPLGNTLGNGADSSALQVPMLTNFISMHCTSLGTSKRHGIAFAPALQKNHPSAASPVYAPAKPAAPSPLHLGLFYFILFDFIIALFCTAVLWSGEQSPCLCPSDSVGRMVRELKQFNCHSAVTSAKIAASLFFSLSRHPSPAHATGPAVVDRKSFILLLSYYSSPSSLLHVSAPSPLATPNPSSPVTTRASTTASSSWCASALRTSGIPLSPPVCRSLARYFASNRALDAWAVCSAPDFLRRASISRLHRSDSVSFQR